MGIHSGHRERKKALFREQGLDGFADHEALELLLFYAIPQKDVNPLAHALITTFGSLRDVLSAPVEELMRVEGIGLHAATLLHLVGPLVWSADTVYTRQPIILSDTSVTGAFFLKRFSTVRDETLYEACLDAKGKLLRCVAVGQGSVDTVTLNLRRIVELAFRSNASSVVLAHNHPSGIALPSADDNQATLKAWEALNKIGIRLLDHIIVADGDFVSLKENGLIPNY